MKKITILLMAVCVIGFTVTANGALVYDVDFDHGVQASLPNPYIASSSEVMPAGALMVPSDVTAGSQLADSGVDAPQGGESLYAWRGSSYPRSGYHVTGGPVVAGNQWTMEFLIKPNWSGVEAILYSIYAGKERIPGSIVNVFPKLYILGSNHKVQWDSCYTSAPFRVLESTTVLQEDQWYHIAVVLDGVGVGDDVIGLYINGVLEDSVSIYDTWGESVGIPSEFAIGNSFVVSTRNFRGLMDAFCIDDAALAPADFNIIPEPATLALLAMGFAVIRKTRKK